MMFPCILVCCALIRVHLTVLYVATLVMKLPGPLFVFEFSIVHVCR